MSISKANYKIPLKQGVAIRICSRISLLHHIEPPIYIVVEVSNFPNDFSGTGKTLHNNLAVAEKKQVRLAAKQLSNKKTSSLSSTPTTTTILTNKFEHTRTNTVVEANIQRRSEHGRPQTIQKYTPTTHNNTLFHAKTTENINLFLQQKIH